MFKISGFLFIFMLVILAAFVAQAETGSSPESVTHVKMSDDSISHSSAFNREDKRLSIVAEPVGFAVAPVPALGLSAGLFLTKDSVLQFQYAHGVLPEAFFDITATTYELNLKYFTGNSFYLKGGLGYRQIGLKNVVCLFCNDLSYFDAGSADSWSANFGIGNQWQWKSFTLGCDWIGVMLPITTSSTNYYHNSGFSTSTQTEIDGDYQRLAEITSYQLLRFYLGASF